MDRRTELLVTERKIPTRKKGVFLFRFITLGNCKKNEFSPLVHRRAQGGDNGMQTVSD